MRFTGSREVFMQDYRSAMQRLSEEERHALHTHLVECATCRRAHQENKIMNKVLEETLTTEKPDPTFEQRMLADFRQRSDGRIAAARRSGP